MKDLSTIVICCDDIEKFWSNWQEILRDVGDKQSPFRDTQVVMTYASEAKQPIISVCKDGSMYEVYPCYPETRGLQPQIPNFFLQVADHLKMRAKELSILDIRHN